MAHFLVLKYQLSLWTFLSWLYIQIHWNLLGQIKHCAMKEDQNSKKSETSSPICIGFDTTLCEYCCKVKQKCCIDDVHWGFTLIWVIMYVYLWYILVYLQCLVKGYLVSHSKKTFDLCSKLHWRTCYTIPQVYRKIFWML